MKIARKTLPIILTFILFGSAFGQNDENNMYTHCGSGIIMGRAKSLPKPSNAWTTCDCKYKNSEEIINVQIEIDENGNVTSAKAVSGHPFLQTESIKAALKSTFEPVKLSGKPVKITGVTVYKFLL
jgi:hypothetical protein